MPDPVDILVTGPLMPDAITALQGRFRAHLWFSAHDREALMAKAGPLVRGLAAAGPTPIDRAFIARCPSLEIIGNYGVGYDRVDVAAAAERGIIVTNTPDVLTEDVADLTLGLMIATVREIPQADRYVREGRWEDMPFPLTATLRGRKVGILGLGRIGRAIAVRCEAMGLPVSYYGRRRQEDVHYRYHDSALALAQANDILIVVAPATPETQHIVNADVLAALGPDGYLINVARGSLVDEPALIAALQRKTIRGVGLDVFANEPCVPAELRALDNVVLLPHVGSASVETRNAMAQLVVDNLVAWFDGRGPLTPVAETPWKR